MNQIKGSLNWFFKLDKNMKPFSRKKKIFVQNNNKFVFSFSGLLWKNNIMKEIYKCLKLIYANSKYQKQVQYDPKFFQWELNLRKHFIFIYQRIHKIYLVLKIPNPLRFLLEIKITNYNDPKIIKLVHETAVLPEYRFKSKIRKLATTRNRATSNRLLCYQ